LFLCNHTMLCHSPALRLAIASLVVTFYHTF
jgi:hypothetical protein